MDFPFEKIFDTHIHAGPEVLPRKFTVLSLAKYLSKNKMKGVVVKSHFSSTAEWVIIAKEAFDAPIYGSLTLNSFVGGLNPKKVEISLKLGTKIVWMPTITSEEHLKYYGKAIPPEWADFEMSAPPVKLDAGKVREVAQLVSNYGAVLSTGHLGFNSVKTVLETASRFDTKTVVTHPLYQPQSISVEQQAYLSEEYGALMEYSYALGPVDGIPFGKMVKCIKSVGVNNCILSSDSGLKSLPGPLECWKEYVTALLKNGLKRKEIEKMAVQTPQKLVGD